MHREEFDKLLAKHAANHHRMLNAKMILNYATDRTRDQAERELHSAKRAYQRTAKKVEAVRQAPSF